MLDKRLAKVYFPDSKKIRQGPQSKITYDPIPVMQMVGLSFPRIDIPFGEVSKASIFGPFILAENRIIQLRIGNCILIDGDFMYRVDEVSMLSKRRNALNLRCLNDGYTIDEVANFVDLVADNVPLTLLGTKLGILK